MLKTRIGNRVRCITQPDHAAVAGFLAAHWGNQLFKRPGHFADAADAELLRAEVIFGIAQHDNGWWEWEATPELNDSDGLPLDLADVLRVQQEGIARWQRGIPRFQASHPYASLLTSFHARWLYVPRCRDFEEREFVHPLYWKSLPPWFEGKDLASAIQFVSDLESLQHDLVTRLEQSKVTARWASPENLSPHGRLLQLLDGLALSLCSGAIADRESKSSGPGRNSFPLTDVPRRSWNDRVEVHVRPGSGQQIICEPYPFDTDPLMVRVPAKILEIPDEAPFQTTWHSTPPTMIDFEISSA